MKKAKITVPRAAFDRSSAEKCGARGPRPCSMMTAEQVFYAGYAKPEGSCVGAWKAVYQ